MKIDRVKLNEIYSTLAANNNNKVPATEKSPSSAQNLRAEKDSLKITDQAKERTGVQGLAKRVAKEVSEPASAEKLLRLKNAVASGTYKTSAREIAEAILGRPEEDTK